MALPARHAAWAGCFYPSQCRSELPIALKAQLSTARRTLRQLEEQLASVADTTRAANLSWFFKTGKGQYGEGDQFLGIPVPVQRKIALGYCSLPLVDLARLLRSKFHEHRFAALEILVAQFESGDAAERCRIVDFYLRNTKGINNWDLVDTSAPYILGEFVKTQLRDVLDGLAASENLWERRIAMVATLALIKNGELGDTFRIAEKLLSDKHDLIRKAVGWMLREAGKISKADLMAFIQQHYKALSRTSLRYAIERFTPIERERILNGKMHGGRINRAVVSKATS